MTVTEKENKEPYVGTGIDPDLWLKTQKGINGRNKILRPGQKKFSMADAIREGLELWAERENLWLTDRREYDKLRGGGEWNA